MKNKAGFTLIEIMVSLVLVGLIASIAGTSVITATRGYVFARENNAITQKAQLALNRLNREFIELSDIREANSTCVVYESPYGRRAVGLSGNAIRLLTSQSASCSTLSGGDTLVDEVQAFSILYNPNPNGTSSLWSYGQDIRNLFALNVQLVLARPDTGGTVPFFTTVSPRNNNNSGGASLPTAANPPPEYSGKQCFVTTAAYGDADHPVVEMLRQFRDRFLLPTDPGKALVQYYYEVGPSLAAAIEDKPIACLFVRLLLTPVAGFAFLALSCPVLIPVFLLLSWGIARLALEALRRRSTRRTTQLQGQRGAMLVTLIAAMVVFAALGAVMIGMFGTSALSQVAGNNTLKAYYLAESGFRYAASSYINVSGANEAAREIARDNLFATGLHEQTFSLGSDGSFQLKIYAYYCKSTQAPSGNALTAKFFGGIPVNLGDMNNAFNAVWVRVQKPSGVITHNRIYLESTGLPSTVILRQVDAVGANVNWDSSYWDPISGTGSTITPACAPDPARLSLIPDSGGYDLAYADNIPGALAFPEKNGIFMVRFQGETTPRILSYKQRDINSRLFKGISDPNGGSLPTVPMEPLGAAPNQNFIELTKFVRLDSTGTFGTGASAVSRKVTYYTPIGYAKATPILKTKFEEKFEDLSKWYRGSHVTHAGTESVSSTYGGSAMRVDSLAATGPHGCLSYNEFEIGLNWTGANIPLTTEWLRAGRYLSYDLQVKMGTDLPSSYSRLFGLNFRLDETGNTLGLSFGAFRPGRDTDGCDRDSIPEGMVAPGSGYTDFTPVITLWAKQYDKKDSAFTVVPNPGPEGCTGHPPVTTGHYTIRPTNLAFWETGNRVRLTPSGGGALPGGIVENMDYFTRKITTSGVDYIYLFYDQSDAMEQENGCWLWRGLADMTNAGSGARTAVNQDAQWTNLAYQTLLGPLTSFNWSTFVVRLIEAPSVSIIGGGGITGSEIRSGHTIYTTSNDQNDGTLVAIARVSRSPVYRSAESSVRNWSGGSAQAILILEVLLDSNGNHRPHVFGQGKTLFVGDHPSGLNAGTVNVPAGSTDIVYRERDNWIAVYVGGTGQLTGDADPYNLNRLALPRLSEGPSDHVLWPVDDVASTAPSNDYFTIVRFDPLAGGFINSTLLCRVDGLDMSGTNCLSGFYSKANTGTAPDILRFSSPDGILFNSPSSGASFPTSRAEVGLHAYGSPSVYFDDFALQFGPGYEITKQGFLLPLQQ